MSLHPAYFVQSAGKLTAKTVDCEDSDIRGLICMWESPRASAQYFMGVAPSLGIINWSRERRTEQDYLTANAAIEIIRRGRGNQPDVQVCEFAAPVHCEDLADYINLLGRLYGMSDDDGQTPVIIEVYPGPGHMTQRRLIEEFGYTNLFVWKYTDQMQMKSTGSLGWFMTPKAKRDLWLRGTRHISQQKLQVRSEYLIEEMADCILDPNTLAGSAVGMRHDDRVRAMLLATWQAHEWSLEVETESTGEVGTGEKPIDWQASDLTSEEWLDACEERYAELAEQADYE